MSIVEFILDFFCCDLKVVFIEYLPCYWYLALGVLHRSP